MIRVQVIASSPIVRAGLEALLREDPRFRIAGPSASSTARLERDIQADVLLIEIASPERVPTFASRSLDAPAVVLLADRLGRAELRRVLHSGVRAVLPRDATAAEITAAVQSVAAGLTVLSGDDLETLLPPPGAIANHEVMPGEQLTVRETEVLGMLAEGLANKDIAARLKISDHTVKFHVSSILGKFGVTTRGEAVARGIRDGLVVI